MARPASGAGDGGAESSGEPAGVVAGSLAPGWAARRCRDRSACRGPCRRPGRTPARRARTGAARPSSRPRARRRQRAGLEDEAALGRDVGLRDRAPRPARPARRARDPAVIGGHAQLADPARDEQPARAGERQRQPGERVGQVRPIEVRLRRPRRGEPEEDRERHAARGREPEREAGDRPEADRDLRERDEQPQQERVRLHRPDEERDRRDPLERVELPVDRGRAGRVEERRIEELVDAGVQERDAGEEADGHEGRRGDGRLRELVPERHGEEPPEDRAGARGCADP